MSAMLKKLKQTNERKRRDPSLPKPGKRAKPGAQPAPSPETDRELVDRCLSGQTAAWSDLYRACHDKLLRAIGRILRHSHPDRSLIDEIAARVWFATVKDEGELLAKFDPARNCRLVTFLAAIARSEARGYLRSERRLRERETQFSQSLSSEQSAAEISPVDLQSRFLDALTPREREFLDRELLGDESATDSAPFSAANSWQLRHRVEKKLEAFLRD